MLKNLSSDGKKLRRQKKVYYKRMRKLGDFEDKKERFRNRGKIIVEEEDIEEYELNKLVS
jgi:hypothetical protein